MSDTKQKIFLLENKNIKQLPNQQTLSQVHFLKAILILQEIQIQKQTRLHSFHKWRSNSKVQHNYKFENLELMRQIENKSSFEDIKENLQVFYSKTLNEQIIKCNILENWRIQLKYKKVKEMDNITLAISKLNSLIDLLKQKTIKQNFANLKLMIFIENFVRKLNLPTIHKKQTTFQKLLTYSIIKTNQHNLLKKKKISDFFQVLKFKFNDLNKQFISAASEKINKIEKLKKGIVKIVQKLILKQKIRFLYLAFSSPSKTNKRIPQVLNMIIVFKLHKQKVLKRILEKWKWMGFKPTKNKYVEVMEKAVWIMKRNREQLKKHAIYLWIRNIEKERMNLKKINNRFKGKIIHSIIKIEMMNVKTALLRWKIRTTPKVIKKTVDNFALYSRINNYTALWRLKKVIYQQKQIKKQNIRKRKMNSVINLIYMGIYIEKRRIQNAFYYIKSVCEVKIKLEESIVNIQNFKIKQIIEQLRTIIAIFHKNYRKKKAYNDMLMNFRNRVYKKVLSCFKEWQKLLIVKKDYYERQLNFLQKLSTFSKKSKKDSFFEFKTNIFRGEEIKRNSLISCMNLNKYKQEKVFYKWRLVTQVSQVSQRKIIIGINLFELINQKIHNNFKCITQNKKQKSIILKQFYQKFQISTFNQVFNMFQKWKTLLFFKGQKFFKKLSKFSQQVFSHPFQIFKQNNLNRAIKINIFFLKWSSRISQLLKINLENWKYSNQIQKQELRIIRVGNCFNTINQKFLKNSLFKKKLTYSSEKRKIIVKNFVNKLQQKYQNTFIIWKQNIVSIYSRNNYQDQHLKKFFIKVCRTQHENVLSCFRAWGTLIFRVLQQQNKGLLFEAYLGQFFKCVSNKFFMQFRKYFHEGLFKKNQLVKIIVLKIQQSRKEALLRWNINVGFLNYFDKNKLNQKQMKKKIDLISSLIQNITLNKRLSFLYWHKASKHLGLQKQVSNKSKKIHLIQIERINRRYKMKALIEMFKRNKDNKNKVKNLNFIFYFKQMKFAFQKMKILNKVNKIYTFKRQLLFYKLYFLEKISRRVSQFQAFYKIGNCVNIPREKAKKDTLKKLIFQIHSKNLDSFFSRWRVLKSESKIIEKYKLQSNLFQNLNSTIKKKVETLKQCNHVMITLKKIKGWIQKKILLSFLKWKLNSLTINFLKFKVKYSYCLNSMMIKYCVGQLITSKKRDAFGCISMKNVKNLSALKTLLIKLKYKQVYSAMSIWKSKVYLIVKKLWEDHFYILYIGSKLNSLLCKKNSKALQLAYRKWQFLTFYKRNTMRYGFGKVFKFYNMILRKHFSQMHFYIRIKHLQPLYKASKIFEKLRKNQLQNIFVSVLQRSRYLHFLNQKYDRVYFLMRKSLMNQIYSQLKYSKYRLLQKFQKVCTLYCQKNKSNMIYFINLWKKENKQMLLTKFTNILKRKLDILYVFFFNQLKQNLLHKKLILLCMSLLIIEKYNYKIQNMFIKDAFKIWKTPRQLFWFKQCVHRMAKSSKISVQIALWRMRDTKQGMALGLFKETICKRFIFNIQKQYNIIMEKAFWMIEGNQIELKRRQQQGEKQVQSQADNLRMVKNGSIYFLSLLIVRMDKVLLAISFQKLLNHSKIVLKDSYLYENNTQILSINQKLKQAVLSEQRKNQILQMEIDNKMEELNNMDIVIIKLNQRMSAMITYRFVIHLRVFFKAYISKVFSELKNKCSPKPQ